MKIVNRGIVLLAGLLLIASFDASALEREYKLPTPSSQFPTIVVKEANGTKTWQAYSSQGANFVALFHLHLSDAKKLLDISEKVLSSYKQIKSAGRCPHGIVKSGTLGKIEHESTMKFEVVCEHNNIQVAVTMYDKYLVNFIQTRVEARQLRSVALKLISALEK